MNTNLVKNALHESITEAVLNELYRGVGNYYYYVGKPLDWFGTDDLPVQPKDNQAYENDVRRSIIGLSKINTNDVSLVAERIDWESGRTYDMFDDEFGSGLVGIDLISGGTGYTETPSVTVEGDGEGAYAEATIYEGSVVDIKLIQQGYGYSQPPTIKIEAPNSGSTAYAEASMAAPVNRADPLHKTNYYVLTDEFNVYKCLDNNNKTPSTTKPSGIRIEPFETSDGYVWKYIYTIPVALRERFLAVDLMPVTTSLTQQFYSGGTIRNARIERFGSGYTYANVTVLGNGHQEKDVYFVDGVFIEEGGTGYTNNEPLNVQDPVPTNDWEPTLYVYRGTYIKADNRIYEVENTGSLGTTVPAHTSGLEYNGDVVLTYYGRTASGRVKTINGVITSLEFDGQLRRINVTSGGSGYTTIPSIEIVGAPNSTADAIMSQGRLSDVRVLSTDYDLNTIPQIIVGDEWQPNTSMTVGEQVFVADRLYTCVSTGTTGTVAPTHTSGTATDGTAILEYAGVAAKATATLQYGEGYKTNKPEISVDTTSGSGAKITPITSKSTAILRPIIQDGQIVDIEVDDGGVAYTTVNIEITGDGSGAAASVDLSIGDVDSQQSNVELSAKAGEISSVLPTSGGYGYNAASAEIKGDGYGASIKPRVEEGRVVGYEILSRGENYSWIEINVVGDGYGAKARAILPPRGGHGSNAIKELHCDTLMFFKDISYERYQGFNVDNEYRQIGIIKDPRTMEEGSNRGLFFNGLTGSTCYAVSTTNVSESDVKVDDKLTDNDGNEFLVVDIEGERLLLIDMNNTGIYGSSLYTAGNLPLALTDVTIPQIDKFSGEMLFIDNRIPFSPSAEEIVNLRTVLQF